MARHLADTIACASAAAADAAPTGLRGYRPTQGADPAASATLIGGGRASVQAAALVGGTLTRHLDANDTFMPLGIQTVAHLSDAALAVVAVAESLGRTGRELLDALIVCYETQGWLAERFPWRTAGYHPTSLAAIGAALGASRLHRLGPEQSAHAVAMAATVGLTVNTWLRPTGAEIGTIKGLAAGLASERGVLLAELATADGTAPRDSLETVWENAAGCDPDRIADEPGIEWTIPRNAIKRIPAQIFTQSVAQAAHAAHEQGARLDDATRIVVHSHASAAAGVQGSPQARAPRTRGDADHSTPFVVAMMLRDGVITPRTYDGAPWEEPELRRILANVELSVDEAMHQRFLAEGLHPATVTVTSRSGRTYDGHVEQFAGHPDTPLSEDDMTNKLAEFIDTPRVWGPGVAADLLRCCARLDESPSLTQLVELIEAPIGGAR